MTLFGTIGIFVRAIPLPSGAIAWCRSCIGCLFLLGMMLVRGKRLSLTMLRKNMVMLLISGFFLGFNWIMLFEAYRYTSIASATLCYYFAPVLVILASPFAFSERLSKGKCICIAAAIVGIVAISGILQTDRSQQNAFGILMSLCAAVLYALIVILNKKHRDIPALDRTIVQLGISFLVLTPYCLMTIPAQELQLVAAPRALLLIAAIGIVHTGLCYFWYFGALEKVTGQNAALISYIDPVVAVFISTIILREPISPAQIIGAVLLLGSIILNEMIDSRREGT